MTAPPDTDTFKFTSHEKGVLLVMLSGLAWSGSGVFSRLLTTDPFTTLAVRSFFGGVALLVPSYFFEGGWSRKQWRLVWHPAGLAMIACHIISQACFIGALSSTSVANVAVIYATGPFIAAFLSWAVLRQRLARKTMIAGGLCLAGVVIIVGSSFGGETGFGNLLALLMTASFAMLIIIPRISPGVPVLPPTVVSAFMTTMIFAPFASIGTLDIHNGLVLAAFGATNYAFAFALFMAGARRIPPAEAALILTMETVLTPTWVWIFFGEAPAGATLAGGAVIVAAVFWHTLADARKSTAKFRDVAVDGVANK